MQIKSNLHQYKYWITHCSRSRSDPTYPHYKVWVTIQSYKLLLHLKNVLFIFFFTPSNFIWSMQGFSFKLFCLSVSLLIVSFRFASSGWIPFMSCDQWSSCDFLCTGCQAMHLHASNVTTAIIVSEQIGVLSTIKASWVCNAQITVCF